MNEPVLVVMAAGMGSRYGGLKQLDPVGGHGQLIVDYSIYDARRAGFRTVVFVIKPENEALFRAGIGDRLARGMDVRYAFQCLDDLPDGCTVPEGRTKPWGTAHAVLAARHALEGRPFAVINADDYYGPESFRLIYDHLASRQDGAAGEYAMVGYALKNTVTPSGTVARGVCEISSEGYLTGITERTRIEKGERCPRFTEDGTTWTELDGDTIVSMNLWGFTSDLLKEAWARFPAFWRDAMARDPMKAEFYLPTLVGTLIQEGLARARVLRSGEQWYGVTYREDKPAVVSALAEMTCSGLYPDELWGE